MRRIFFSLLSIVLLLTAWEGRAQSPPGINYQGIARNPDGKPLAQKEITIRINILNDGGNGDVEYAEVHSVRTNSFGLFTLVIGTGSVETGDFRFISWAVGNKWLRVEMDPDGGNSYQLMGSQQFMSVPYAFYSKYSGTSVLAGEGIAIDNNNVISNKGDADADPGNEFNEALTLGNDHVLRLTDAGGTREADLSSLISPGSTPQDLELSGDKLKVTDNASATEIDLAPYRDNTDSQELNLTGSQLEISGGNAVSLATFLDNTDAQQLSLSGTTLGITGGNSINVTPFFDNTDAQQLNLSGSTLSITGGNSINVTSLLDNTDAQQLNLSGSTLSITGGNSINVTPLLDNTDAQNLSLAGTTLSISGGTGVDLAGFRQDLSRTGNNLSLSDDATAVDLTPYLDNTDSQNLSLAGTTLSISGGTGVNLSALRQDLSSSATGTNRTINITNGTSTTIDVADNDNNTTNEIQDLSRSANTLTLSGDATPVDLTPYLDDTDEQRLALAGMSLSIDRGNSVSLAAFLDDTDDQDLTHNAATHSLSLSGDPTPVNLTPYMDNTDSQNLSIMNSGNNRTINIDNGVGVTFSVADGDSDATNELQSLTYNSGTKVLSISTGNNVSIPETQNLNEVLMQSNDANGQRITNLGAPTTNNDAVNRQYVDNATDAINNRLSANYAFKTTFAFATLLSGGSNIPMPLSGELFDDFSVVNSANFTAQADGFYIFTVDGSISSLLVGSSLSILHNGTKYPVSVGSNNRYNTTQLLRVTTGQTVSLVADGIGINTNIAGSFFGYKLP